jgi:putative flippase GtrA
MPGMTATALSRIVAAPRALDRRPTLGRAVRCLAVSVGTTLLSTTVLVALAVGARVPAGPANAIGVVCGIPVSYTANRRWVWHRRGPSRLRTEVVPFWTMCLLGLVASTVVVGRVGALTAALPDAWRSVLLPAANAGTFAALWLVQFVVLDRVVFRTRPTRPGGPR